MTLCCILSNTKNISLSENNEFSETKRYQQECKICLVILDHGGEKSKVYLASTKEKIFCKHLSADVLPRTIPFWWDNSQ